METKTTFLVELVCPKCGRSGTAHASSRDLPSTKNPVVSLDQIPFGFKSTSGETASGKGTIQCDCGSVFSPTASGTIEQMRTP